MMFMTQELGYYFHPSPLAHLLWHVQAEAYSFGGELTISNQTDFTICTLTSAAPIFDLVGPDSMAARLVSEFEGHYKPPDPLCGWSEQFTASL